MCEGGHFICAGTVANPKLLSTGSFRVVIKWVFNKANAFCWNIDAICTLTGQT